MQKLTKGDNMSKLRFENTGNGFVVFSKNWFCGLGENVDTELALHVEINDMFEMTGEEEFKQYPIAVSIGIVVANPHKSFLEHSGSGNGQEATQLDLIQDAVSYMGSVPVGHILVVTDALNKAITSKLKIKDAALHTQTADYGTVAAQNGKGASFSYPVFKNETAAKKWVEAIIEAYANTVMGFVGFTLDKPINMAGDTGWSIIEKQVNGA